MRALSAASAASAVAETGEEPIVVVRIEWPDGPRFYADRDIAETAVTAEGRILEVAPSRGQVTADGIGSVGSVSVALLDWDQALLAIMTSECTYKVPAAVFHYFVGGDELVPLMDGFIEHPVVWKEAKRTLEFDIVSKFNSEEILCSDEDNGPFPLAFGRALDYEAFQDVIPPVGTVLESFDQDATEFIFEVGVEGFTEGELVTLDVGGEHLTGIITIDGDVATVAIGSRNVIKWTLLSATSALLSENQQIDLRYVALAVTDERLPGNWLTTLFPNPGVSNYVLYQSGAVIRSQLAWYNARPIDIGHTVTVRKYPPTQAWWTHSQGTRVREVGQKSKYVINCVEDTTVLAVKGEKDGDFVTIPESWYTVKNRTVNGHAVTGIVFDTPLGERGFGSDTIFVSVESPLSDNTAEAIQWILENRVEGMSVDAASFTAVAAKLENYPSRFAITKQGDALKVAADIAWQARCGLYTIGSAASIVYLSEEPDTVNSLAAGDANVLEGTPELTYTEDLVTRFTATWQKTGLTPVLEYIVENNIELFGLEESEFDFFIYDRRGLVVKSADFWSMRRSRLWTLINLGIMMDALGVDVFDAINLSIEILSPDTQKASATLVEYDTDSKAFTLLLWTPIECGTNTTSTNAWVDDSGDTKPNKRQVEEIDFTDEIEAQPLDLTWTNPVALGLGIGETDGVFSADEFRSSGTGGTSDGEVSGNRVGDWPIGLDDEVVTVVMPDDQRVAFKPSAPIVYLVEALEDQPEGAVNFDGKITKDLDGEDLHYEEKDEEGVPIETIEVINTGDEDVVEGDVLPVWRLPSGEWVCDKPSAAGGSSAAARVGTKITGFTYNATIGADAVTLHIVNAPSGDTVPEDTILLASQGDDGTWFAQVPVWL